MQNDTENPCLLTEIAAEANRSQRVAVDSLLAVDDSESLTMALIRIDVSLRFIESLAIVLLAEQETDPEAVQSEEVSA